MSDGTLAIRFLRELLDRACRDEHHTASVTEYALRGVLADEDHRLVGERAAREQQAREIEREG